jgi:hypothetical protein
MVQSKEMPFIGRNILKLAQTSPMVNRLVVKMRPKADHKGSTENVIRGAIAFDLIKRLKIRSSNIEDVVLNKCEDSYDKFIKLNDIVLKSLIGKIDTIPFRDINEGKNWGMFITEFFNSYKKGICVKIDYLIGKQGDIKKIIKAQDFSIDYNYESSSINFIEIHEILTKSRKSSVKPRKSTVKSRKSSVKPRKSSVKPRKSSVKPRKSSVKPRKSSVKPRKSSVNSLSSSFGRRSTIVRNSLDHINSP